MTQLFGWIAMVLAVSGVWMNNHRMRLCFVLWFFSNGISAAPAYGPGDVAPGRS